MIILKTTKPSTSFEELNEGNIFEYNGNYFIKTNKIDAIGTKSFVNAVCLLDGRAYSFDSWDKVTPIKDYELTIRG